VPTHDAANAEDQLSYGEATGHEHILTTAEAPWSGQERDAKTDPQSAECGDGLSWREIHLATVPAPGSTRVHRLEAGPTL
jgi:hypothetical protein